MSGRVVPALDQQTASGRSVLGIHAGSFWQNNLGDQAVRVAVLDGQVDLAHPCFDGAHLRIIGETDSPPTEHGTYIASLIFGQPGTAVRGIAPRCQGLVVPVFREMQPEQSLGCTQREVAAGIRLAVAEGADVINISGGQIVDAADDVQAELSDAVRLCERRRVLVVAAAGNDGCRCLHAPAAQPSALAVGAISGGGVPMDWSNWGDAYQDCGVMALGRGIVGAVPGGGVKAFDGTSCATAIVSGISALLVSLQLRQNMAPDPLVARQAILDSAERCDSTVTTDCRRVLVGTIRAHEAAKLIRPYVESTRATEKGERKMIESGSSASDNIGASCECGGGDSCTCDDRKIAVSAGSEEGPDERLAVDSAVTPGTNPLPGPPQREERAHSAGIGAMEPGASAMPSVLPSGTDVMVPSVNASSDPRQAVSDPYTKPWTGACNCGGSQLVFFIGEFGFNFGRNARRDSFDQDMPGDPPHGDADVLEYIDKNPWAASSVIWTIGYETIPVYAVAPFAFEESGYARMRKLMADQLAGKVARISVPGLINGSVDLLCGGRVPVIVPDLRGVREWDRTHLHDGRKGGSAGKGNAVEDAANFLNRVFYELRSPGLSYDDRAINFAATEGFTTHEIFKTANDESMELEKIAVDTSPICRPGSVCRDVLLTFFNPRQRFEQARKVYRLTVDVADTVPSRIGEVRSWHIY